MTLSHGKITLVFSVFIAAAMILSGLYVLPTQGNQSATFQSTVTPYYSNSSLVNGTTLPASSAQSEFASTVSSIVNASQTSRNLLFLPDTSAKIGISNGHVSPLYTGAPAPMGIGDFGLVNGTGENYSTSSFNATITITNMSDYYLLNDGPHSFSGQLNAVLTNVSLDGNAGYSFWTQNVLLYSTRTNALSLEDNIWNFTTASSTVQSGTIANSTGNIYKYPGVHIAIGPTFTVTLPFTVSLYLNYTKDPGTGDDVVYFNYTITGTVNGTYRTVSNTFDRVQFNSHPEIGHSYPANTAHFFVSGTTLAPNGLLYDAEFMIGGPGGGSTTSIYNISANLTLKYLNGGKYQNVKSAYDFGTDTGETSSGIAEYYSSGDVVHLNAGPSLLYGLWNTKAITGVPSVGPGYSTYSGEISPSNGFVFVNAGSEFNETSAQWAPTSENGNFSYRLPTGNYYAQALMSNYNPMQATLSPTLPTDFKLQLNYATGIYTPIFASGNGQLKNISYSGDGTGGSPYVLFGSNETTSISPLFAEMNDFTFPVFGGIMISNVSDFTVISPPSFRISYPSSNLLQLTLFDLPDVNYLTIQVYASSNMTIENSSYVTGWFSQILEGFPLANMVLWNTTDMNITGNYFSSQGSSLLIYNDDTTLSNNTVTGNVFSIDATITNALDQYFLNSNSPVGLQLYSSYNKIYNNIFSGTEPAMSPGKPNNNIYNGENATYNHNLWNISRISSTNIIGGSGISGNYWMSNTEGVGAAVNESGLIAIGSDQSPLNYPQYVSFNPQSIPFLTELLIEFQTSTLTPSNVPAVLFGGTYAFYLSGKTSFSLPNGTYEYYAEAAGSYSTITGNFTVAGENITVNLSFTSTATYTVEFVPEHLVAGSYWNVTVYGNGYSPVMAYSGPNVSLVYSGATDGTYYYSVSAYGYILEPPNGTFTVSGRNIVIYLDFKPDEFAVSFTESGLSGGTTWSVSLNGQVFSSTNSTLIIPGLVPGTYNYTVNSVSGYVSSSGGTFVLGFNDAAIGITFTQSTDSLLLAGFAIVGVVIGGLAGSFMVYTRMRKR